MATIPDAYLDLLQQKKAFADLATLMPDGTPQVTPVWFDYTGGVIRVNSAKGRTKARNMKEGAPVALSIMDPDNPYRYLQVRGKVTRVDRGRCRRAYRLAGEEVSRQGQVSLVAAGRCAGDVRDHAGRRAGDGLNHKRGKRHAEHAAIHRRGGRPRRDPARPRRRSAHLRRQHARSVFRARRRDGAGSAVADGSAAPPRARPTGGDPRARLPRQRHRASDRRHRPDRRARSRCAGRGDAWHRLLRWSPGSTGRSSCWDATCRPNSQTRTMRPSRSQCAMSWRSPAASGGR